MARSSLSVQRLGDRCGRIPRSDATEEGKDAGHWPPTKLPKPSAQATPPAGSMTRPASPLEPMLGRRFMAMALLEPDRITATDRAAAYHVGIDTDVDSVVLGRRAQDPRIFR